MYREDVSGIMDVCPALAAVRVRHRDQSSYVTWQELGAVVASNLLAPAQINVLTWLAFRQLLHSLAGEPKLARSFLERERALRQALQVATVSACALAYSADPCQAAEPCKICS